MPRFRRLQQRSDEWRCWRLQGVGSSDAPAIVGDSPWKTAKTLWEFKTGRRNEESDNLAKRRGRELEAVARAAYEAHVGEQMEPHCVVHDQLDWMRASLDGLSFDGLLVLEVKCPLKIRDHQMALAGRIPEHYYAQLQHQLEVSQADEAHYWSFDGRQGALVRVQPDRDYIELLIQTEAEFWKRVIENYWPQPDGPELDLSEDPNWRSAALRYQQIKTQLDELSCAEQKARKGLESLAGARRTFGCGIEVVRTSRKGSVDYAAIPELAAVDLERYRKPPVEVLKINIITMPPELSALTSSPNAHPTGITQADGAK